MGTPDLESTQKGAPGDTVHFGQDLETLRKIPQGRSYFSGCEVAGDSHALCDFAYSLPMAGKVFIWKVMSQQFFISLFTLTHAFVSLRFHMLLC
jgi:hypothetical protein